jgi:hypothetical protein
VGKEEEPQKTEKQLPAKGKSGKYDFLRPMKKEERCPIVSSTMDISQTTRKFTMSLQGLKVVGGIL